MAGYTKLFGSILESTIWLETPPIKVVWITLLAMADRDGIVEASVPGLAKRAGVERTQCEQALAVFLAPDPDSRTTEHEGRRIEVVAGGWRLLNYDIYRQRASKEDAAEKNAARQKRFRDRLSRGVTITPSVTNNAIAPSPSPASSEEKEKSGAPCPSLSSPKGDPFKDETITERAGRFIERYADLYPKHRKGARYAVRETRDYAAAVKLCATWPDERLDKLAVIFLTTDHEFAEGGSRTIPQFLALASWCDGRLAEYEHKRPA